MLDLFQELQQEIGFACLFISHDLAVVEILARRIAVMQMGKLVEFGTREQILTDPQDLYTKRLLAAVPVPDPDEQRDAARRARRAARRIGGRHRALGGQDPGDDPRHRTRRSPEEPPGARIVTLVPVRLKTRNCYGRRTPSIGEDDAGACTGGTSINTKPDRANGRAVPSALQLPSHSSHEEDHHVSSMRRTKRLVALAAGLSLVVAACGDDDDDDSDATTAPRSRPRRPKPPRLRQATERRRDRGHGSTERAPRPRATRRPVMAR